MTHVKPEIMRILNSKDEYKLVAPIKYIEQGRDPRIPDSKDFLLAKFWISLTNRKSSGVATAQTLLSSAYVSKVVGIKNVKKALYWAKKAAKNEEENIFIWLGMFYSDGKFVKHDYKEAMEWFEKACNAGEHMLTLFGVATLYHAGERVKKNHAISLLIYKAYTAGIGVYDGRAYFLMGDVYKHGSDGVPRDYRKAHECFLKAYELGYCEGATSLGGMYCQDQGVEKNTEKAFQWFMKGAAMGSLQAVELIKKLRKH